ncbi:MAG TPA: CHAT domain-containing tetratricopeptide repeat protein [Acetobacteraceae bacterium]|nr:CHAT domain-containing tetratricopeptide repeat protein [Acetobacteraceae bacterium]
MTMFRRALRFVFSRLGSPAMRASFTLLLPLMLLPLILLPVILLLAGCATPAASDYAHALTSVAKPAAQISIGKNGVGEDCTQTSPQPGAADVYCGTWQEPSARVRRGISAASPAQLEQIATASPWRDAIDTRFHCNPPTATTILNGDPAALLQCTQLVGGWPHVAMVADVAGKIWYADGVLPAARVMERSIGVLAGVMKPDSAPVSSAADALLARRLAAQAFTSGDVGQFEELMVAGTRANLADNTGAAEAAFRAALALQQKLLGKDNPETATTIMSLALQLSNEGRFAEADALFARAAQLASKSADPTAVARWYHYRGLDAMNQGKLDEALKLLTEADSLYAASVPQSALHARPRPAYANSFVFNRLQITGSLAPDQALFTDPRAQSALLGLIEVRRNRAVLLRVLGKPKEADELLLQADDLAQGNGLARPMLDARLFRTSALTSAAQGQEALAMQELAQSTRAFDQAFPGSKPLAETYLIRARELLDGEHAAEALPLCQSAVSALVALKAGTTPDLMAPCLDVFAQEADAHKDGAQTLLDEMFTAAQLAQGSITSEQIAQAAATLAENTRDPKVGDAIRKQRDLKGKLDTLYSQRDDLALAQRQGVPNNPEIVARAAELDKEIQQTQAQLQDADSALQAAAPNYGQLVQQVVTAQQVFAALHPGEALAAITVADRDGWVFLLRNNTITVSKVGAGLPEITTLVKRVRAGIEETTAGLPEFDIPDDQRLYALTLGGVARQLQGARALVVAPSGPLLSLPFEVLLTGAAQPNELAEAPWLVRQFTIVHVPAPSNFVSLRKIAGGSRATQPWFGFGDFQPVTLAQAESSFPGATCSDSAQLLSGLPLLPYATKELNAARVILDASPSDELLGPAFTAQAVMKLPLKNFRILHFATHALLPTDLRCQTQPAIVTSDPQGATNASGALLTASDVVGMNLDADLIILSACNSGGPGGSTAGESLSGLARAFFYAGARALLVTHWSVNDQVAAYLVADTLLRMKQNPALGVAGALRNAQLAMLAQAGKSLPAEIAHPFFWAPFAVIGEGGERVESAQAVPNTRLAGL